MSTAVQDRPARALRAAAPGLLPPLGAADYGAFLSLYGSRPRGADGLLAAVADSGLSGRGGGGFPTARKLAAVRAGSRPVVVANGTEGEPTSHKDKVLMRMNPHLVIDGTLLAAEIVGARRVTLAVERGGAAAAGLRRALASRPDGQRVEIALVPSRFVAGEESALVHFLNGGEAKPTVTPPRPFERGVDGRPTLVQNVETLACLALIARYGADWFRAAGTGPEAGVALATVTGAVAVPGVVEVPLGVPVSELFARCGGLVGPTQAYLVGGYFGRWVPADDRLALGEASLARHRTRLGARAVVALAGDACGVTETARAVGYMAAQSAEQCGPCVFGLRALADRLATVARCGPGAPQAFSQLAGLQRQIARRGACAHPDGVLEFAASATQVFGREFAAHLQGRCSATALEPVLPTPDIHGGWT